MIDPVWDVPISLARLDIPSIEDALGAQILRLEVHLLHHGLGIEDKRAAAANSVTIDLR